VIFVTARRVGENLGGMRAEGLALRWNQAGNLLINDSEGRVLIKYVAEANVSSGLEVMWTVR